MAQGPDRLFEHTGVRLTPRAKVLLNMILSGLEDEPIRWQGHVTAEREAELRTQQLQRALAELPGLLRALAEKTGKLKSEEPVTLFDMLHHFESTAHVMFFPGKLP
jgi:hypothetical protein